MPGSRTEKQEIVLYACQGIAGHASLAYSTTWLWVSAPNGGRPGKLSIADTSIYEPLLEICNPIVGLYKFFKGKLAIVKRGPFSPHTFEYS